MRVHSLKDFYIFEDEKWSHVYLKSYPKLPGIIKEYENILNAKTAADLCQALVHEEKWLREKAVKRFKELEEEKWKGILKN